jgi:hypothetical protein
MFASSSDDTIIDRVIADTERKHAKGKRNGGKHPVGYQVDKTTRTLVIDEHEAVIVRLIFDLSTKDRVGSRATGRNKMTSLWRARSGPSTSSTTPRTVRRLPLLPFPGDHRKPRISQT